MTAILVNWFTVGVLLIILEMILPGIFLMWFGLSALIVGIITLIIPMPINAELILFAILSVVTVLSVLILVRKHVPDTKSTVTSNLNQVRGAELIGHTFTLDSKVINHEGKINIGDTAWLIHGPDSDAGTVIKIEAIKNNVLMFSIQQ